MSDRYRIEVSGPARRQLPGLPARVAPAIVEFLTAVLPDAPHRSDVYRPR